jgi:pentapeptide MXKDX repeat protein
MLKQLAAIGIGAALILAPVASFAQTATPTPAATSTPMMKKVVKHHVVKHHVVKKPMMVKKPMVKHHMVKHHMVKHHMAKKPMPAPTPTPTKS